MFRDPEFRRKHAMGQRRRWGIDHLTEDQMRDYRYLRDKKNFSREEALKIVERDG